MALCTYCIVLSYYFVSDNIIEYTYNQKKWIKQAKGSVLLTL